MTPGPPSAQATFCATLVDEWVRCGVQHAVISPGSRSTPLALALLRDGRVRVHVHHDERAAAFMALGIGLATGAPALVVTTSGTAAVELHPAVVEADLAAVPMVVCTADRPRELWDVGAPQTIDQTHLYGRSVRWFAEPGVADAAMAASWRSVAARAVSEATGHRPGPVHLNVELREPLLGDAGELPPARPPVPVADLFTVTTPAVPEGRGVIVAGGCAVAPDAVAAAADALGWPVLADPRSGARVGGPHTVAAFDALLRDEQFAAAHRPDVILQLGALPASRVLMEWLAGSGAVHVAVDPHGRVHDPNHTVARVIAADPSAVCRSLIAVGPAEAAWLASWQAAEAAAQAAIDRVLAGHPEVTEPGVARALVGGLVNGSTLVVASSMPVRDVEWYGCPRVGLRVLANRGANGIDGVVSTAIGVALASATPVTALVGDVAFLHDSNALLGLAGRDVDLAIVVVDNDGGGIFSFLPQAEALTADEFELLFGTPHGVNVGALAELHDLPVARVRRADELLGALDGSGARVVHVHSDRAANVAVHRELNAAVAAALGALRGGRER